MAVLEIMEEESWVRFIALGSFRTNGGFVSHEDTEGACPSPTGGSAVAHQNDILLGSFRKEQRTLCTLGSFRLFE